VVYKVDRLTRSLADFAKLVELENQASGGRAFPRPRHAARGRWAARAPIIHVTVAALNPR
jgi:hypothetical protein